MPNNPIFDRVGMSVSGTPGVGTITLGSALGGYRSFAAAGVANTNVVRYLIEDGADWEFGLGTYTATGTTLSRDTVLASSAGGTTKISATAAAYVYTTATSADLVVLDSAGNATGLGTPASANLANCTGLPISTGVSGLGTGVATFLASPTAANLASAVTGETGTGNLVFATSPTLVTPLLGTPTSGTLTNCTGLPLAGVTSALSGIIKCNGASVFSAAASGTDYSVITRGTSVTASGTAVDFTGIPSTARRVTVQFANLSTNGTGGLAIQVGTSGGIVTTGYTASTTGVAGSSVATINSTTAVPLETGSTLLVATASRHGTVTLTNITGNQWVATAVIGRSDNTLMSFAGGSISLGAALDRIRLTSNGTDTFDAGTINIFYE